MYGYLSCFSTSAKGGQIAPPCTEDTTLAAMSLEVNPYWMIADLEFAVQ